MPDGDRQKASFMMVDSVRPGTRALQNAMYDATLLRPDQIAMASAKRLFL